MENRRGADALMNEILRGGLSRRDLLKRAAILGISGPTLAALVAACGDDDDDDDEPDDADVDTEDEDPGTEAEDEEEDEDPADTEDEDPDEEDEEPADDEEAEDDEEPADDEGEDEEVTESSGQLVLLQGVDSNTLDPLVRNSVPESTINRHVFDMMTNRNEETLEIEPNIVEDWTVVDDTTWEFKLVEGAEFHDGTPVNAEAAVFTVERSMQDTIGDSGRVHQFAPQNNVESAEVVDEYTFRINTSAPAPIMLDLMQAFEIVPPSHYTMEAEVVDDPVGSGKYRFVEWVRDDHITLEANPDHWDGPPPIQEIIVRPVPEDSSRVIALQNEEAHIIVNVPPELVPQVEEADNARISDVEGGRSIFVGIRNDIEPFGDVRVRQALNYALDFDSISAAILEGFGEKMATIVNPPNNNPDLEAYPFDPEMARSLLEEAGVEEGTRVVMNAPRGRYIKDDQIAEVVAQNFRDVGFDIDLQILDWSLYAGELLPSGEPDALYFLGLGSPFSGQEEINYVHPDYSLNYTRWENEEYVDLYAQLRETLDTDERTDLMYRLQEIIHEECPWVFVWKQTDFYGVAQNLEWEARADEAIIMSNARFTD
jgi:peptide/nickel transport system substrate-binding protein